MTLLLAMGKALALTIFLETLFALLWGIRGRGLQLVFLMNLMTNPGANLLYQITVALFGWSPWLVTAVLESAVVLAEGLCCKQVIRRPWLFALLVNSFSYGTGVIIQHIC